MNSNLKKLMNQIPAEYDGVMITSSINRHYYTGIPSSAGVLIANREKAMFIIDFRYIELFKKLADGFEVVLQDNLDEQMKSCVKALGIKNLAIESDRTTVSELNKYKSVLDDVNISTNNKLADIITIHKCFKTPEEFKVMQAAQNIADKAFTEILNYIKVGVTEQSVSTQLAYIIRQLGAQKESFDTIAVSGVNTSLPHGKPTSKLIEKGDFFTLDFGVMVDGYCSDTTRTVAVGYVSDEQQKVYDIVLKAQLACLDAIKPGVACREIDKIARDIIYGAGYEGCFGHGLGHSLGLEIHESPRFNTVATQIIEPGLMMSVEPGIYLEGKFGCRIEDVVFVTENGSMNLTSAPKNLIIL